MSAIAAIQPSGMRTRSKHLTSRPTCTVCAASMVAAEASAFVSDNVVSYLWSCDVCGYGFVTDHALGRPAN